METVSVVKDGRVLVGGLTPNEAFTYILQHQSQSVDWAIAHEGWTIIDDVDDEEG
jgi:hypothetical protein